MGFSVVGRRCRFFTSRSVGSCIRSATSMSSSPSLMLPPIFGEGGKVALNFHSLGNKEAIAMNMNTEKLGKDKLDEVYFAGSSHGWLFAHNEVKHDVFMLNPINGRHIKLPPLPLSLHGGGGVSRVALSCLPDNDNDNDNECRAMIIFGGGRLAFCVPGRSTEWTPIGSSETCYADAVYSSTHNRFFCIPTTYLSELRYSAAGKYSELEVWDMSEPQRPRLDRRIGYDGDAACPDRQHYVPFMGMLGSDLRMACWHIKYLLVHGDGDGDGDHLYVVVRYVNPRMREDRSCAEAIYISKYRGWDLSHPYKTFLFDVFKIKIDLRDPSVSVSVPVYMDMEGGSGSLEGLAMFVGTNQSLALLASDHPHLKPDSIYFSDEHRFIRKSRAFADTAFGGHDNGIFDYQNNTFSSCCCGTNTCPLNPVYYDHIRKIQPAPLWFTHSPS